MRRTPKELNILLRRSSVCNPVRASGAPSDHKNYFAPARNLHRASEFHGPCRRQPTATAVHTALTSFGVRAVAFLILVARRRVDHICVAAAGSAPNRRMKAAI